MYTKNPAVQESYKLITGIKKNSNNMLKRPPNTDWISSLEYKREAQESSEHYPETAEQKQGGSLLHGQCAPMA